MRVRQPTRRLSMSARGIRDTRHPESIGRLHLELGHPFDRALIQIEEIMAGAGAKRSAPALEHSLHVDKVLDVFQQLDRQHLIPPHRWLSGVLAAYDTSS